MSSAVARSPNFDELYAEIEALPEGMTGEILGQGGVRTMRRPGFAHGFAARRLVKSLATVDIVLGGAGWWIEREVEIRSADDRLLVPDLAGWRSSEIPDFVEGNPGRVTPDWVCEILSRSTQRADRVLKLPQYARWGVGHIWVIDPAVRTLEVYASRDGMAVLVQTAMQDAQLQPPPFDLPLDLATLWGPGREEHAGKGENS